jgi:hypothetical protein
MWEDPIVAEVHRIRREIMTEFDGDMDAYYRHIRELEEQERKRGRIIVDRSQQCRSKTDAA